MQSAQIKLSVKLKLLKPPTLINDKQTKISLAIVITI